MLEKKKKKIKTVFSHRQRLWGTKKEAKVIKYSKIQVDSLTVVLCT